MAEIVQSARKFNKEDEDDEIYEMIEAPKFVDFTARDLPLPDDRSWFCLRVGCDQQHEEIDPDALYKSFVLRVMAARSPNLRLRKALSRRAPSANMKCPLSAPAKPSKPRISRLMAVALISQKMADAKVKVHPLSKLNSTPNCKAKEPPIAAKALTTPRNKKVVPNPDHFRSVRNPKTTVALAKNRVVAKALVFNSPKKTERMKKTSLECQTPVTEICSGMKKLEINSQRKVPRNSCKPLRRALRSPKKFVTSSGPFKSQLSIQKSKIRVEVSGNCKDPEARSLRCRLRRKSKTNLQNFQRPVPQEDLDKESSDMEIDGKSRNGSLDVQSVLGSSRSNERTCNEEHLITVMANSETDVSCYKHASSLSNSETDLEEKDPSEFQTWNGEGDKSNKGSGHEENIDLTSDKESVEKEVPVLPTSNSETDLEEKDPSEFQTWNGEGDKSNKGSGHEENIDLTLDKESVEKEVPVLPTSNGGVETKARKNDDKENVAASDDDRDSNLNKDHSQRKNHKHGPRETHKKANCILGKTFKGSSTMDDATVSQGGGKYKKTKPTNPKPFRLRTDERGILREANLERRQLLAPLKEITQVPKFSDRNSQRWHGNERNEKSDGQCRREIVSQEGNQIELDKKIQKVQPQPKTPKCTVERPKMATNSTKSQKKLEDGKEKALVKKLENRTTTKSQLLLRQLVRPQRVAGTRKATISLVSPGGGELGVIKENSSTISRPKNANPDKNGTFTANAASASRSSSRGRRSATVPKEPNFHRIHTPKTCTKFSS